MILFFFLFLSYLRRIKFIYKRKRRWNLLFLQLYGAAQFLAEILFPPIFLISFCVSRVSYNSIAVGLHLVSFRLWRRLIRTRVWWKITVRNRCVYTLKVIKYSNLLEPHILEIFRWDYVDWCRQPRNWNSTIFVFDLKELFSSRQVSPSRYKTPSISLLHRVTPQRSVCGQVLFTVTIIAIAARCLGRLGKWHSHYARIFGGSVSFAIGSFKSFIHAQLPVYSFLLSVPQSR